MNVAISGSQSCLLPLVGLTLSVSIAALFIASVMFPTPCCVRLPVRVLWICSLYMTMFGLMLPCSSVSGPMSMFLRLVSSSFFFVGLKLLSYRGNHGEVICVDICVWFCLHVDDCILPSMSYDAVVDFLIPAWCPWRTELHSN